MLCTKVASATDDIRKNDRHRVSYKWVRLLSKRCEYIGIVSNISNTGIMISGDQNLAVGEAIQIGLQGDALVGGRVKWRKGNFSGIAFDEPIDVQDFFLQPGAGQNGAQSRSPRFKRAVQVSVKANSGNQNVDLVNISPFGLCVDGISGLRVNQLVRLHLGKLGNCQGQVRWVDQTIAGISFARTMHIARLSEWLVQSSISA